MDGVNLVCVSKPHKGAVWRLDRTRRGLRLCDDDDNVILRMTAAEAILRPSFAELLDKPIHCDQSGSRRESLLRTEVKSGGPDPGSD